VERHRVGVDDFATVSWTIVRGTRRTVGGTLVQGNVETRDALIERQLPFQVGDPLNPEALQEGQDAVYGLGTYRSVSVRPLSDTDPAPIVGVEVQPRPPGSLQWGAGYNTRDGFTLNGEIDYDNLGRRARRISLRGQISLLPTDVSSSQYLAALGYREPQFLRSRWTWKRRAGRAALDPQHRSVQRPARRSRQRFHAPGLPAPAVRRRGAGRVRRRLRRAAQVVHRRRRRLVVDDGVLAVTPVRRPQRSVRADARRLRHGPLPLRPARHLVGAVRQAEPPAQPGHAGGVVAVADRQRAGRLRPILQRRRSPADPRALFHRRRDDRARLFREQPGPDGMYD
jgi:hypothetical protein